MSIGAFELGIVALILLVNFAIPTATLVVAILIYRKLDGVEQILRRRE